MSGLPTPTRDGYDFANWTLGGAQYTNQAVKAPVTLVAQWAPVRYTVTFDANGGDAVPSQTRPYDQALTNLPQPQRAGADFAGWYDANGQQVSEVPANTKDVTLTARWTCKAPVWDASNPGTATWTEIPGAGTYTATLMKQGAGGQWVAVSGTEQTVAAGTGSTATANFHDAIVAEGPSTYAVTVSAAGVDGVGAASTSPVSNNLFTVSVDENNGSATAVKQLVVAGSKVNTSALGTPAYGNNHFEGWTEQLQNNKLGTAYDATVAPTAPLTLHAQWQLAAPTFDADASKAWTVSTTTATDASLSWGPVTGAAGYTVQLQAGGSASGNAQTLGANAVSASFTGLTGSSTTYTAAVTAEGGMGILSSAPATSPDLYTVAWAPGTTDAVSGLPTAPRLAPAGSEVSRPAADPVRSGYVFAGWQAAGASVLAPNAPYTVNAPVTFSATWGLKAVTGVEWGADNTGALFDPVTGADSYTVHVIGSDGAASKDIVVDAATATMAGGKVSVDLSGAMGAAGTYTFSVEAQPAANSGLTAQPAIAVGTSVHSVSFVMNNATSAAEPMRFVVNGGAVGTVAEPSRDGATFNGWTGGSLTVATKDISAQTVGAPVTYTATWTMNQPADLEWSSASSNDATAQWSVVDDATGYVVTVYKDGQPVKAATPTDAKYTYTVPAGETGTWTFSVTAQGDNAADSQAAVLPTSGALYSVSFDGNGATAGVPGRQLVVSGGHATQPATSPTRTGYTFSHWALPATPNDAFDFAKTPVMGATEIQAQWTQDVYTITYHLNGGTNPAGAPVSYTFDAGATLPMPTRTGYGFAGWYDNAQLTGSPVGSIAPASSTGNKEYWAKWDSNGYTAIFDGNAPAGSTTDPVSSEHFSFDTGLAQLPVAKNSDYVFAGWNTKADGTGQTLTSIAPSSQSSSITLYAQWQLKAPAAPTATAENTVEWTAVPGAGSYSVKVLDANGAEVPSSEVAVSVSGTKATLAPTAAASGKSYTVAVQATGATTGANIADSAWSAASAQLHAVTFDAAGGTLANPAGAVVLVGDGQEVADNGTPTLSGRTCTGWFASGAATAETFPATVNAPVTYTAQWQWNVPASPVWTGTTESRTTAQWAAVPGAASYTVTLLDASGNAVGQPQTVTPAAGSSLVSCNLSSMISGAGTWRFSVAANGAGTATSQAATSGDLYSVRFDANGGTLGANATEFVYATSGQKLAKPADPTRSGCGFLGWKLASATGTDATWPYDVTGEATLVVAWNVSAPTDLAWNTGAGVTAGTAQFTTVPGATGYTVTLTKDGQPTGVTKQVSQPTSGTTASVDLSADIMGQGAGTYGFTVEATGAVGTGAASATLDAAAPQLVTVSYNANVPAGQAATGMPAMQLCVAGATNVTEPSDPAWASNAFAGWKSSPTAAASYTFGQPVDAPVELFATWTLASVDNATMAWDLSNQSAPELSFDAVTGASGYTVTLHSLGAGAATATTTVVDAAKVAEANGTVTVDLSGLMTNKGTYWVSAVPTSSRDGVYDGAAATSSEVYTVSFLGASGVTGTAPAMQLVAENGTAANPGAGSLTRPGADFAEWRVSGQTSAYNFADPVTGPVELQSTWRLQAPTGLSWTVGGGNAGSDEAYPHWTNVAGATGYTVALYNANDLSQPLKTEAETDGTSTLPLDIPADAGAYVFTVTAASSDPTLLGSAPSAASAKLLTVDFSLNGGTSAQPARQLAVEGDATVTEPSPAPSRPGATFGHWTAGDAVSGPAFGFVGDAAPTAVTAPVTLAATWTMVAPAADTLAWTAPAQGANATTATWASVDGNEGYTVTLSKPDGTTVVRDVAANVTSCDFAADITGAGTWTFSVVTKGTDATPSAPVTSGKLVSAHFDANGAGLLNTPALNGAAYVYVPAGGALAEPANEPTCDGYAFGGWQVAGADPFAQGSYTMGDAPVDLVAQWTPRLYAITYNLDGGTNPASAPDKYTFGVAEALPTPAKTGYEFGGWYTNAQLAGNPVTSVAPGTLGDQTLYAKWTASSYRLTWDVNAPAGAAASTDKTPASGYTFGQGLAAADFPKAICSGYVFDGWYDAAGNKVTEVSTTSTGNMALTARWSVAAPANLAWDATAANSAVATWTAPVAGCTYNVNLYKVAADGTLVPVATKTAVSGTSVDLSAEIRNASNKDAGAGSYVFDVTATTATTCANGSAIGDSALARLDQATTPKLVTVSFDPAGGSDVPLGLVVSGHKLTAPVSTRADASLDGWYEAGSASAFDFANTAVTAPLDLAARWTLAAPADPAWSDADATTATWKPVTGATGYSVQLYKDGQPQGQPVSAGAADASVKLPVSGEGTFTFTVTALGAGATANSAASVESGALYSVSYNGNGASVSGVPATAYVKAGETVAEPQNVGNGSSVLVGWFDATGAQHSFSAPVTAPLALTAHWQLAKAAAPAWELTGVSTATTQKVTWAAVDNATGYKVTLVNANGASQTKTVTGTECTFDIAAGGPYTVVVQATGGAGYIAGAVSDASGALVTLAFDADGGSPTPAMEVMPSGTVPTKPAEPSREHYTFDSWREGGAAAANGFDFAAPLNTSATVTAVWQLVPSVGADWNPGTPGQAAWAPVASATGYTVTLYRDNAKVDTYNAGKGETSHTFSITAPGAYTFQVAATGTGAASPVTPSDHTLYTVSFDTNGANAGSPAPAMQLVVAGQHAQAPSAAQLPVRDGAALVGWSAAGATGAAYDFSGTPVNAVTTLTAVWQLNEPANLAWTATADGGTASWDAVPGATGYNVEVKDASGAVVQTFDGVSGTSQTVKLADAGAYTFTVVAVGAGAANPALSSSAAASDVSAAGTLYSVTYHGEGGTLAGADRVFVSGDQTVGDPGDPSWAGRGFTGWRSGSPEGPAYSFGQKPAAPVDLYATWKMDAPASAQWSDADPGTATWDANPAASGYTVTLTDASGAVVAEKDLGAGVTSHDFANDITVPGTYRFSVVAVGDGAGASDATVSGTIHTVTYHAASGTSGIPAMALVKDGQAVAEPAAPTLGGASFVAWAEGSVTGAPYNFADAVSAPVELWATWKLDAPAAPVWDASAVAGTVSWQPVENALGYSVQLLDGTGAPVGAAVKTAAASAVLPVSAPGTYGFEVVATGAQGFSSSDAAAAGTAHTVTFDANGGTGAPAMRTVADGATIGKVAEPTRAGMAFNGWVDAAGAAVDPAAATVTAPMALTASWKLAAPAGVTWDLADGASVATWQPVVGAAGYEVTVTDGTGATSIYHTTGTSLDLKLSAPGSYTYTVTAVGTGLVSSSPVTSATIQSVTYDYNDGVTAAATRFVEDGATAPDLAAPDRSADGWAFDGWRQDSASGAAWDFADGVKAPVALVGAWKGIEYKVVLDTDGGTVNAGNVTGYTHGQAMALPTDVTHDGCTFAGWYTTVDFESPDFYSPDFTGKPVTEIPASSVGDVTYHAKWVPITYTLDLDPEGGVILDRWVSHYTYGSGFALPQHVFKPGHTFEGWYTEPDGGVEVDAIGDREFGDVALYAHWAANDYTISLDANGGVLPEGSPDGYVHGQGAKLPVPTRDGYTFDGWYDNADLTGSPVEEVPADAMGDKAFWAKWSSRANEVTSVTLDGVSGTVSVSGDTITVVLPAGSPLPYDASFLSLDLPEGATATTPVTADGGRTWRFAVTAEDGSVREYTVLVSVASAPEVPAKPQVPTAPTAPTKPQAPTGLPSKEELEAQVREELARGGRVVPVDGKGHIATTGDVSQGAGASLLGAALASAAATFWALFGKRSKDEEGGSAGADNGSGSK